MLPLLNRIALVQIIALALITNACSQQRMRQAGCRRY